MINDQIDRYLNQSGIPQSLRPSLRDFARLIADISARSERRDIIERLTKLPPGYLVADLSLSLARSLHSPGPLVIEDGANLCGVNAAHATVTVQP